MPCYLSAIKTWESCQSKLVSYNSWLQQVGCWGRSWCSTLSINRLQNGLLCFCLQLLLLKWGVPQACHMDTIFDLGASIFQNLRASKHKFSSQIRLCVTWVSHSIPDLSFPICDFSCPSPCRATILLFVQGLDRTKSIQGTLTFFRNICSGLQSGSCCIAGTTLRSELFVDFLLFNH